ncbi:uncharacterized protein DUF4129 [Mycobacterium sp. BK558]|nr:uncharacterized protein DUF4129 [Mycobacterium sp. BK558]
MVPIDIDRDAARDAARRELSKAIYPRESLTDQILTWIERLLYRITAGAASVPGGWFTVAILLVLLAVAVLVAVRIARRAMRSSRSGADLLFDDRELSAAEHRAAAERDAAAAAWASAIRHRLRAVARHLEENGTLAAAPGRTATELARDAGRVLPVLAGRFGSAAEAFNDVTYGELPGHEAQYRMIVALDDDVVTHRPAPTDPDAVQAQQDWAALR